MIQKFASITLVHDSAGFQQCSSLIKENNATVINEELFRTVFKQGSSRSSSQLFEYTYLPKNDTVSIHALGESLNIYLKVYDKESLTHGRTKFYAGMTIFEIVEKSDECSLKYDRDSKTTISIKLDRKNSYCIGRKPESAKHCTPIKIENSDSSISRCHCILSYDNSSKCWTLTDNSSSNGTFLHAGNGEISVEWEQLIRVDEHRYCYFSQDVVKCEEIKEKDIERLNMSVNNKAAIVVN